MSAGETAAARRLRVAAGVYVAIRKQRTILQARARQQLQQHMLDGQQQALDAAIVMSAAAAKDKAARRTVKRAAGTAAGVRGSTIGGYLQGDDTTYLACRTSGAPSSASITSFLFFTTLSWTRPVSALTTSCGGVQLASRRRMR